MARTIYSSMGDQLPNADRCLIGKSRYSGSMKSSVSCLVAFRRRGTSSFILMLPSSTRNATS